MYATDSELIDAIDEYLIGVWENGVYMSDEEYHEWLGEIRARGLVEEVFG